MKAPIAATILFAVLAAVNASLAIGHELSGYVAGAGMVFFNDPLFPGQERDNASFALQPEYYHEWGNGSSFTFVPFARLDSADSKRSHFDVRELSWLWLGESWELRIGIGKVFWGVTEFLHLVDIINQTDLVEALDGEEKLGQPMIHLSIPRRWGVLDLILLPYFRERTFPGHKGRLRSALEVDTESARYESARKERHLDFAFRYSHTIGDWDFGIYNFDGTGREPTLLSGVNANGESVLIPFYEQVNQTGLDIQVVEGNWLFKLEALYRTGQREDFLASVGGFEYALENMVSSGMDLGMIGEWAYDERGDEAATSFQNDAMFGLRLAVNDAASSELLLGFIQDLEGSSRALSIEGSRRVGDNWLVSVESRAFLDQPEDDPLYSLRDDAFFQLELACYF